MEGEGEQKHWSSEFQHEKLSTPELKESFTKTMSKFPTQDDVAVSYMELEKSAGKPFKLPESMDKLPDDKTRQELRAGIGKLLGVIEKPEDLKGINFTVGMPEGSKADEGMVAVLSKWAIGKPKDIVQDGIKVWNETMIAAGKQMEAQFLTEAKATDEALIALPEIGSKEKLAENDELVRRMFQNNLGLTPQEYETVGQELVKANFTRTVVLRKALMAMAKNFKTGTTVGGEGGADKKKGKSQYQQNKERWPNTPDLWGPEDK